MKGKCYHCGAVEYLKRGWTGANYCSEQCERIAVSSLHNSMPGGPNPYRGWMPHHISVEISQRWSEAQKEDSHD